MGLMGWRWTMKQKGLGILIQVTLDNTIQDWVGR